MGAPVDMKCPGWTMVKMDARGSLGYRGNPNPFKGAGSRVFRGLGLTDRRVPLNHVN